jgi:lipoyl(octanoyl) transferase
LRSTSDGAAEAERILVSEGRKIGWVVDLGLIAYRPALELQRRLVDARKAGAIPDVLLLCEHPHVITLGRNGKREHLRASGRLLAQMNAEFQPTDRGGDITYHGPGQIVGYPILDLTEHRRDVRWYVAHLEEIMIRTSAEFGVAAKRIEGKHGIWVGTPSGKEKLGALGVRLSCWVTSHGFAYNVSTDLRYFDLIVPCGIVGSRATSLERVLGRSVRTEDVRPGIAAQFGDVFGREMITLSRRELDEKLAALVNQQPELADSVMA